MKGYEIIFCTSFYISLKNTYEANGQMVCSEMIHEHFIAAVISTGRICA